MFNLSTNMDKEFYDLSEETFQIPYLEEDLDNLEEIEYDDYETPGDFDYE